MDATDLAFAGIAGQAELLGHPQSQKLVAARHDLEAQLGQSLCTLLSDRDRLRSMGSASRALFEARFSPEVRAASFAGAMNAFLAGETGR